jgi:hypothetical protein
LGRPCDCEDGSCCGGNSGCCDRHEPAGHFERCYQTRAEQIADLEAYLSDLKTELQAVEEHLADLKK